MHGGIVSVRLGLLALLADQSMHGYQLRQEFEARTGGTWPLNIGQVYTTLARLGRDGLVEAVGDGPAAQGVAGHDAGAAQGLGAEAATERYALTEAGRAEVARWWTTPVARSAPARDELAIKLALAVTVPGVDVVDVVQRQRTESMRALRDFTRLRRAADARDEPKDLAWTLVLDNLVFTTEAEMRWLDHVEARLARVARVARLAGVAQPDASRTGTTPSTGAGARATASAPERGKRR
ncbi:transcriptional regulator, PadR family [Sanguibacter gelidistatuariae]|uniref:Transcriptional regulator, PadR family n=1 Tax=Sanguibacter gelidistatuariae TaxID=1814289 RepID=A0A1G6HHJ6_9MICO|nr:transcriptional regulator, PadR family [Sanguibacter gelidistatuariae]